MGNPSKLILLSLCVFSTACGGEIDPEGESGARLPIIYAPLDTLDEFETLQENDADLVETSADVDLRKPAWLFAELKRLPSPKELTYVRYENPQYGYSFAYPDTLYEPVQAIGEERGMEFATSDSSSRILAFAVENAGRENLETQYQAALGDLEARVTYRARDEEWYIVAGMQRDHVFYEKTILSDNTLKTLRINYPPENRSYYDAVTAVMASSFK